MSAKTRFQFLKSETLWTFEKNGTNAINESGNVIRWAVKTTPLLFVIVA